MRRAGRTCQGFVPFRGRAAEAGRRPHSEPQPSVVPVTANASGKAVRPIRRPVRRVRKPRPEREAGICGAARRCRRTARSPSSLAARPAASDARAHPRPQPRAGDAGTAVRRSGAAAFPSRRGAHLKPPSGFAQRNAGAARSCRTRVLQVRRARLQQRFRTVVLPPSLTQYRLPGPCGGSHVRGYAKIQVIKSKL